MARPYSSDLRERVVEAVNEGATRSECLSGEMLNPMNRL
jgi:hypothetical protein